MRAHKTNKGSSILSPQYSRALLYMARGPFVPLMRIYAHARMKCKHLLAMACLSALFVDRIFRNEPGLRPFDVEPFQQSSTSYDASVELGSVHHALYELIARVF